MIISIEKAEYIRDYTISFYFSDGSTQAIDFEGFLRKSNNPMIKKYLNKDAFKSFTIEHGDIMWNDYEMCFPIWDLREGNL